MGKYDDAMYRYLSDNDRFADLFNAVLFGGRTVVRGENLESHAERSVDVKTSVTKQPSSVPKFQNSTRDIIKRFGSEAGLWVLGVENQNEIDYTMPYRILQYQLSNYREQIENIKKQKEKDLREQGIAANHFNNHFSAGDKLCPIYTICFYHGTEKWNGPRSLKDMMDFGKSTEAWKDCFQDYHMFLFCAGEQSDLSGFHTELKLLLEVLRLRQDKEEMDRLWDREDFSHVHWETAETIAVMTDSTELLARLEQQTIEQEGEEYDMCLAMEEIRRDWIARGEADGMTRGRAEGRAEGKAEEIVAMGLEFGLSESDILNRLQNKLHVSEQKAEEYLGLFGSEPV